ncbi:peptidoglycan-binding domain-containing protein [Streptomyces sp. NRRL F-4474]|uniref:peptidoglycan-binding domain-containing protein n=1 Tax=Streptomyces sp. NRRL F-4474 TaxID=1463851 RepID=UPI0004CC5E2A|nr:peptidoglycan-binding domain-containing protein [Streptomyces sp. NRRL F-4474]
MSQHPEENGLAPEDALLVRPYIAPSGPPAQAEAAAWPQTGPFAFPGPAHDAEHGPEHSAGHGAAHAFGHSSEAGAGAGAGVRAGVPAATTVPPARGARRAARAGRRSRLPAAVAGVLGLAAAGALVLLLTGPDPERPRAEAPADLSLPALPDRSPDAATGSPGPPSARSAEPSASATGAPTGPGTTPPAAPSASAPRPSNAYVTLRMGDSGPEVRALQEMLYGQGFTYVAVTGVYDGQTKRGVGQLQRDRSIKGDPQGVYGPNTQAAME